MGVGMGRRQCFKKSFRRIWEDLEDELGEGVVIKDTSAYSLRD